RDALTRAADRLEAARYAAEPPSLGTMATDVRQVLEWYRRRVPRARRLHAALLPGSGRDQLRSGLLRGPAAAPTTATPHHTPARRAAPRQRPGPAAVPPPPRAPRRPDPGHHPGLSAPRRPCRAATPAGPRCAVPRCAPLRPAAPRCAADPATKSVTRRRHAAA